MKLKLWITIICKLWGIGKVQLVLKYGKVFVYFLGGGFKDIY